jgi:sugar phosphate isomerase/epimerase
MYKNLNLHSLGHELPFDQTCALARQHGFAGVDLDLGFLRRMAEAQSLEAVQAWFAQTGLRAGAFGLGARWHADRDDGTFEQSLAQLADDARLAAALGCSRCVTWVMPGSDALDFRQHWAMAVARLQRVAAILAEHGIRLGLEFVGPLTLRARFKHDFLHTLDGVRALAAATGDNVGLLVDIFHWYTAHGSLHDLSILSADEVVYVHLNDALAGRGPDEQIDDEREMVGATGVIDIQGFLGALRGIGYDGPVTVEPFNQAVRAMSVEEAVRFTSESLDRVLSALG